MWQDMNFGFSLQSNGDLYVDTDAQALKNSLRNILLTMPGTRRMNSGFALGLQKYIDEFLDQTTYDDLKSLIYTNIMKYENRAVIDDIIVQQGNEIKTLYIQINFHPVNQEDDVVSLSFILKEA